MRHSWHYSVYGLTLETNQPLPGLHPIDNHSQVDIWVDLMRDQDTERPSSEINAVASGMEIHSSANGPVYHLWFRGDGQLDFEINPTGTHISATWDRSVLAEVTGLLLGPVLACALRVRGVLCLHACVMAIHDGSDREPRAIAIVGESGAGKSTTAAAFAQWGHPVLADDVAALEPQGEAWWVQSGYPRLRLWPATIEALYGSEADLSRIFSFSEKRFVDLIETCEPTAARPQPEGWRFYRRPLPLAAIYVLGQRQVNTIAPAITAMSPAEAVITLMHHRSAGQLMTTTADQRVREFAALSRLGATLPIRSVTHGGGWEALPSLCDAIITDLFEGVPLAQCLLS